MDSRSVDVILEFLRKNNFNKAEAALRSELSDQCDVNGALQKLSAKERISSNGVERRNGEMKNGKSALRSRDGVLSEFVVEEIGCKTGNGLDSNCSSTSLSQELTKCKDLVAISSKVLGSHRTQERPMLDLYPVRLDSDNGSVGGYQNGDATTNRNLLDLGLSKHENLHSSNDFCIIESDVASTERRDVEDLVRKQLGQLEELDAQSKFHGATSKDKFAVDPFSRSGKSTYTKLHLLDDCSVETLVPLSDMETSTSYHVIGSSNKKDHQKITYLADVMLEVKEQVDEVGRSLHSGGSQEFSEKKYFSTSGSTLVSEKSKEELPRLRPVRIKSEDKLLISTQEKEFVPNGTGVTFIGPDNSFRTESYLDIPIGQNKYSGETRITGNSWLSVSQGISEDISDLVSGFATVGGTSESADYQNEYWDSDEYDDDEDVGYMRQPIEDESWFLAHELDYPSDNEKQTGHRIVSGLQESAPNREEGEGLSFAEEDSYLSGEHYYEGKIIEPVITIDDDSGLMITEMYHSADGHYVMDHDGKLIEEDKLNLMHVEPMWKGCTSGRSLLHDVSMDQDQQDSLRSIGVGMNSDSADIGSDVRGCIVGGISEDELEYLHRHATSAVKPSTSHHGTYNKHIGGSERFNERSKPLLDKFVTGNDDGSWIELKNQTDGEFSFSLSLKDGQLIQQKSGETLSSNNFHDITEETDDDQVAIRGKDDMLLTWKRPSGSVLLEENSNDEHHADAIRSEIGYVMKVKEEMIDSATEEDTVASVEDEEVSAMQEQLRQIKSQEEEFETFNLKIVHRKNRTGFEEEKNFNIVLNSIIAARYHVTEYLGSAAFSKAIQAHDLCTGIDVCVKIIKNNKDFFDQSLDEIKLLKFVNKNDPGDKYHVLRLYDYFYYREHLLIVCELLKANLYEFQKFNRESGGEVYFTMPRLQSITIQCLEALVFLHGLGLIHSDLKPENILIKSYSRCEVKIIDLGSSCFETDHLCSYVQSRSYRAPEVFLGLLYDRKIDIWSLGCILAELCSGNVLFQNDSPATLLARVTGIIGPIDQGMLTRGRDTHKYFTKNQMLYERNQETNQLEYLIPKKSSLKHRLPMGDEGFIQFVAHLLETDPDKRPSAAEALRHPWLSHPYEPISS